MVNAAILRIIWLARNDMVFNQTLWVGMQVLWRKVSYTLAQWSVLVKAEEQGRLMAIVSQLEDFARAPPLLLWSEPGTPERKARTELEVCVLNQNRGADEPLKITTADLARTLKANALMMVGDGDGFWVLTRN
jgi:hypothetical protein